MNATTFFPIAASIVGATLPRQVLVDTRKAYDAGLCGYDRAADPADDGEGLIITDDGHSTPSVELQSGLGTATLTGLAEIRAAIHALQAVVASRVGR